MLEPPVQPMTAAAVTSLPEGRYAYEPKWDGWRALLFRTGDGVFLQSRTGKPLARYFPDLVRVAREALPAGLVLDGELVVWERALGRTSFALLQRRVGGAGAVREAYRNPATFAAFDLLAVDGEAVLAEPLHRRRVLLETLLDGAPPQLALTPHTLDVELAREWLAVWPALGMEGVVAKDLDAPYTPGKRGWLKLRERNTAEAVVGGVTGGLAAPDTVLLGRYDLTGRLRYTGRTKPLAPAQRAALAPLLTPAGQRRRGGGISHPWPQPLPVGWAGSFGTPTALPYHQVAPALVVEVRVDAAYEHSRWRHPVDFVRPRPDLNPADLPLVIDQEM